MTIHYSKFKLNTYATTPYFATHVDPSYPLDRVLIASRTHRNLPPNLKELAALAKRWAVRKYPQHPAGIYDIESFYDDEGYELNPGTGERLTEDEINKQWDGVLHGHSDSDEFEPEDIPVPTGNFANPDTWEAPTKVEESDENSDIASEEQILSDIKARGREYTARYYGAPADLLSEVTDDEQLASEIIGMRGKK